MISFVLHYTNAGVDIDGLQVVGQRSRGGILIKARS